MGRKSAWAAARAEVIASGGMVAGRGNWGGLLFLKTRNVYWRGKTLCDRTEQLRKLGNVLFLPRPF
jgi:hypothetical protein